MAISFISQTTQEAASITTMPTHLAGDLILIFAFRDGSAVVPTLPAGYTSINTSTGGTAGARLGYKIAASGSETSGTWTNATDLVCHVYRGISGVGATSTTTASSATVNYPALTLNNSLSGTSWVAGFAGHQSVNGAMNTAPTGMTNRSNLAGATADAGGHDTNGTVIAWTSTNVVTSETAAQYISMMVEIYPDTYIENTNKSSVSVPVGVSGAYITMIGGGGGGGGGGIRGGTGTGKGGGGGGGGAHVKRVFVPSGSLGATYSITRGTGGGGGASQGTDGTAGNASTFTSGSSTVTANGGAQGLSGANATTPAGGGAGGTASIGSFTAVSTETGGTGSAGSTVSGQPAGNAATGGSTTHSGAGGGGGGGNISSTNPWPGAGGSSSTGAGGTQVTANSTNGNPGTAASLIYEGGGAGGGGSGGNGIGTNGGTGGAGASAGAGGGGGGGKEGSSGSGGAGGAGAIGYTLVEWVYKVSTFSDNFDSGISANWTKLDSSDSTKVTSVSGAVKTDHISTGGQHNGLESVNYYDLTGDSFYVKVVDFGDQTIATHSVILRAMQDGSNYVQIQAINNTLRAYKVITGSSTQIGSNITLDYIQHRWFRIRESGGTTFFDTSPDGSTWTNRFSQSNPIPVTAIKVKMATQIDTTSTASYAIFDNFNTVPSLTSASTLTDTFTTKDTSKWYWNGTAGVTSGKLDLPTDSAYGGFMGSNNIYDMTNTSASIRVAQIAHSSVTGYANTCFMAAGGQSFGSTRLEFSIDDSGGAGSTTLWFNEKIGGVNNRSSVTYDPALHVWWRFRHSGSTVYWETSIDGVFWTQQRSSTPTVDITGIWFSIQTGCNAGVTASDGLLDSFNIQPASALQDAFGTGIGSGWTTSNSDNPAQVTASSSRVRIDHTATTQYNSLTSNATYDLTGSSIHVNIVDFGNQALASHDVGLQFLVDSNNFIELQAFNNTIQVQKKVAGTQTGVWSTTLDTTAHRWFRIREASGTTYCDTSPDGWTWTNRYSVANLFDMSAGKPRFFAGCYANEASASYAIFDNFNTVFPVSQLHDGFDTKNTTKWSWNNGSAVSGGRLSLPVNSSYGDYISNTNVYSLKDSYIFGQLPQRPNVGNGTTETYIRVYPTTANYTNTGYNNCISIGFTGGAIFFQYRVNSIDSTTTVSTTDSWFRIEESGGTLVWYTSADGISWTSRRSISTPMLLGQAGVTIEAGYWGTEPSPGTALWDNINTAGVKAETLVDNFATKDTSKWNWFGSSAVVSGQLNITPANTYPNINTTRTYDLTNSYLIVKLVQPPNTGSLNGCETLIRLVNPQGGRYIDFDWYGDNKVYPGETRNGVYTGTGTTYNSTNHKWMRIRESGGTVYWDVSSDGTTWTTLRSQATDTNMAEVNVYIYAGCGADTSVGTAIWDSVNAKAEYLRDNFTTQDTAKWTWGGTSSISSGQLNLVPASSYTNQITSTQKYDLTGSVFSAQLIQPPNNGNGSIYTYLNVNIGSGSRVAFSQNNGTIYAEEWVSGSNTQANVAYNATNHKFFRIRESGGNLYWDTSPDGIAWTNLRTKATTLDVTNVWLEVDSGYNATEPSPGTAIWDNVNLVPVGNLTDNFASLDSNKWSATSGTTVTGGRLSQTVTSTYTNFQSNQFYDLRESSISIELAQIPNLGNGSTETYIQLMPITGTGAGLSNTVLIGWSGGNFLFAQYAGGVWSGQTLTYSSTNHRFLRLRETGGILYADTAPADGITWTNRFSVADPIRLDSLYVLIQAGYWGTEPSPGGPVLWDNVNLIPSNTGNMFLMFGA